ncbi:MAG: MBL fold metallo-hydrolase [Nocardioidaceae bacterium]
MIDLGYGTLGRLLDHIDSTAADGIDAVVITHKHPDHMLDLHGLFRARWFSGRDGVPIPVYAAEGVRERLIGLEEDDDGAIDQVFTWHGLPGKQYQLGPFRLDSWALPHFVPNAGVQVHSRRHHRCLHRRHRPRPCPRRARSRRRPLHRRGERPLPASNRAS